MRIADIELGQEYALAHYDDEVHVRVDGIETTHDWNGRTKRWLRVTWLGRDGERWGNQTPDRIEGRDIVGSWDAHVAVHKERWAKVAAGTAAACELRHLIRGADTAVSEFTGKVSLELPIHVAERLIARLQ